MRAGEGRGEGRRTANGLEVSQALAGAPRLQIAQVIGLFEACEALCVEIQLCSSTGRSRKDERNFSDKRPIAINNDSGIYKASESGSERSESERSASERSASERTEREREGGREGERGRERERGREGEMERMATHGPAGQPDEFIWRRCSVEFLLTGKHMCRSIALLQVSSPGLIVIECHY